MKLSNLNWIFIALATTSIMLCHSAYADLTQLIPETTIKTIAEEISGETAKRNLDTITLYHRTRASLQFKQSADHIIKQLKEYGFQNAVIRQYPADGKTLFGTQKSRPAWDVDFAELWMLQSVQGEWTRDRRMASWDAVPLSVAQDSLSGDVTASLVDIGSGMHADDYLGKDLSGKLVLTSSQPGVIVDKAVGELGAAGIISYAPNQKSAWWKEDDRLVRWGHIGSFPKTNAFGFMISLGEARQLQQRLGKGEDIRFHAKIQARHYSGKYSLIDAAIAGSDKMLGKQEIVLTCHLDHPRPGANDNASGCVSILEVARTLKNLIDQNILPQPKRTIRFIWPAEIEGSLIYLVDRKDTHNIKANIHMDMVGGGPETKAIFRVSGGPMSIPTFISDLGHQVGHFVNQQSEAHASGKKVKFPLTATEGGKEPLMALMEGISMGSDHQIFNSGSWKIPGLYLHDWPDRYIHTNFDTAAMIDPTKLKRATFIGAISSWYLANMSLDDVTPILALLKSNAVIRTGELIARAQRYDLPTQAAMAEVHWLVEQGKINSVKQFVSLPEQTKRESFAFLEQLKALANTSLSRQSVKGNPTVFKRNPNIKGTMNAFGYSYLNDKLNKETRSKLSLLTYSTATASAGEIVYEALNLVDGTKTVGEIHKWLVAEFGPIPEVHIYNYLLALESIDVLEK